MEDLSHTKMKNCEYLGKAIYSALMLGGRYTPRQWSWQKFLSPQNGGHFEFSKFLENTKMLISRKPCYMEWTQQNFGPAGYLCRIAMPIFKIFLSRQIQRTFLIFLFFAKHKNAYILKTVLDRADCADFGCHNIIRLETKHFLNTLALTFISFSGRFVFAMQKHYLFFLRAIL